MNSVSDYNIMQIKKKNEDKYYNDTDDDKFGEKKRTNLIQFCRMFCIKEIPIVDFFVVYGILYFSNQYYLNVDYKCILIGTIPATLILNLLLNKNSKPTLLIMSIILISIVYLLIHKEAKIKID